MIIKEKLLHHIQECIEFDYKIEKNSQLQPKSDVANEWTLGCPEISLLSSANAVLCFTTSYPEPLIQMALTNLPEKSHASLSPLLPQTIVHFFKLEKSSKHGPKLSMHVPKFHQNTDKMLLEEKEGRSLMQPSSPVALEAEAWCGSRLAAVHGQSKTMQKPKMQSKGQTLLCTEAAPFRG